MPPDRWWLGRPAKAAALGRPRQRRELRESLAEVEDQIGRLDAELRKVPLRLRLEQAE